METDIINPENTHTLDGLFAERVKRTPHHLAYVDYNKQQKIWQEYTWQSIASKVARWQAALLKEELMEGDRVAILLKNSVDWVVFDQACLGLGLVTVPLYTDDRPDNSAYILHDSGAKLLFIQDAGRWKHLSVALQPKSSLETVILQDAGEKPDTLLASDSRLRWVTYWLTDTNNNIHERHGDGNKLASIVYTSGTTGHSKGVMLSHKNMLSVAYAGAQMIDCFPSDTLLSFLPLSHSLERTTGYYLPIMVGASVSYARSVPLLSADLLTARPSILIAVPRIFEKVYAKIESTLATRGIIAKTLFKLTVHVGWQRFLKQQGRGSWSPSQLLWPLLDRLVASKIREKFGGNLRFSISGGAALSANIARVFIALGIPIIQGYGLTETSPVIAVNTLGDNIPSSVGLPLNDIEVAIGDRDELIVKTPGMMLGYWNNPKATTEVINHEGWLHTGDQAKIEDGHIYITGRIKDILVLSNGEKIPPSEMETAINLNSYIEQALVIGEGKAFLSALIVLDSEHWPRLAQAQGMDPLDSDSLAQSKIHRVLLNIIKKQLHHFPGYAKIRKIHLSLEPWTIDNGLLTPTLKPKRPRILKHYHLEIYEIYR